MTVSRAESPVTLELDAPLAVARWRPLVHWLLAIPQLVVLYALQLALNVLTLVAFFTVLFTAGIPRGMFDFMVMVYRYQWRVTSYVSWMRESYPPFDFAAASQDPGNDPAKLEIVYPARLNRLLPFVKWFLALPHYVVLLFLGIAAFVALILAFFAVLFTGRWPEGMRRFVVGVTRWSTRVQVYIGLLTDQYPPFSLE